MTDLPPSRDIHAAADGGIKLEIEEPQKHIPNGTPSGSPQALPVQHDRSSPKQLFEEMQTESSAKKGEARGSV